MRKWGVQEQRLWGVTHYHAQHRKCAIPGVRKRFCRSGKQYLFSRKNSGFAPVSCVGEQEKKASYYCKQGFLASQPRLHHAKTPLFRLCGMSGTAVQTALFWNPKYVKVCENTAHYTPKNRKLWIMYRTLVSICKESGQNKGKQRAANTKTREWREREVTEFQADFKKERKNFKKNLLRIKKKLP